MEVVLPHPASLITNPIRLFTRVEYDYMVAQGFFNTERVELVFGMLVEMAPIDAAHVQSVARIDRMLQRALYDRAQVLCQSPFAATDDSEPEPDIYVTPLGDDWRALPDRADLVIEVARTSIKHDRGPKVLLYGLSYVDEYWIVDHNTSTVEVYRDRQPDGTWRTITQHTRNETLSPLAFPDVAIAIDEILPPA
jgi:Uma2 family endonuclease